MLSCLSLLALPVDIKKTQNCGGRVCAGVVFVYFLHAMSVIDMGGGGAPEGGSPYGGVVPTRGPATVLTGPDPSVMRLWGCWIDCALYRSVPPT